MPLYTIINDKTGETEDVMCSYDSLQDKLKDLGKDWRQQVGTPSIVSTTGNVINKTSGDWKNLMQSIKKGAGRGSNIKT
jgi:hypothetical protein